MKPSFAFQWHITDECDQRCRHCYIFSKDSNRELLRMSFENMEQVLQNCLEMCATFEREPYFYLTGGDPILHPDFWRLAELLNSNNLPFAVMGNPFHLTENNCRKLKEKGCRKYQLSLDGLEKTHDRFRKPGSFKSTLESISLIRNAGMFCAIMSTVSSFNMTEIPRLIDLVASLEVDVYTFGRYCPTGGQKREEYHITPQEYREFLLKCQDRIDSQHDSTTYFQLKDHLWTLLLHEQGRFVIPQEADHEMIYGGCHCGIEHMTILPDGDVFACRRMESKVGNAFKASMKELFLSKEMDEYRCFEQFEKCKRCVLKGFCRGCPAVAYGYTGNMYTPDPQCWIEVP